MKILRKFMYAKYTKLCSFFEKLFMFNIQNYEHSLKVRILNVHILFILAFILGGCSKQFLF